MNQCEFSHSQVNTARDSDLFSNGDARAPVEIRTGKQTERGPAETPTVVRSRCNPVGDGNPDWRAAEMLLGGER
jgi:hypothetical protein